MENSPGGNERALSLCCQICTPVHVSSRELPVNFCTGVETVSLSYTESKNRDKVKDCRKLLLFFPPIARMAFERQWGKFFQNRPNLQLRASHFLKCLEEIKGLVMAQFQLHPSEQYPSVSSTTSCQGCCLAVSVTHLLPED